MKKKFIASLLCLLGIGIIGAAGLQMLGFFDEQESGILIESVPESIVFIDNVEVGKTPYESNLKAKSVTIKIKPIEENDNLFDDYETKISLVPGIKTIIKRNFSANQQLTSGVVVSFEKNNNDEAYVLVVSQPDNAQIKIDGKNYGYTPLKVKVLAGNHNLLILRDGFVEQNLAIKVYKGYKLTALIKLAQIQDSFEEQVAGTSDEVKSLGRIKIKNNDVGFLRVRSGTSVGFPEVAQVKPGEVYEILEEGEHGSWYKVQVPDVEGLPAGRQGWVKAEFVTKL